MEGRHIKEIEPFPLSYSFSKNCLYSYKTCNFICSCVALHSFKLSGRNLMKYCLLSKTIGGDNSLISKTISYIAFELLLTF